MKRLRINKRIHDWEIWVLKEKGLEGGKNKGNLGRMKWTPLRKSLELILRMGRMMGSSWRETHRLEIELRWQSRWSRRISIHIAIWEHHLGKVWIQHLTSKQLEYHNLKRNKKNQGFGLQNKPEQTYDRDFVRSFRGGAHTGSIVQHHHVQGSAHDIRSVPESA